MANTRLIELDGLRGVAAVMVVIYHYFFRYDEIYGHVGLPVDWAQWGSWGVQIFFIISGFVIYWSLNKLDNSIDFVVSRFARLYPVYWFSVFFTFFVVFLFGLLGREVSISDALLNLLMVHEYLGVSHVDGVYWTLTVEVTFYFWIFLICFLGQKDNAEVWLVISLVVFAIEFLSVGEIPYLSRLMISDYIAYFISGICLYKLLHREYVIRSLSILFLCLIICGYVYGFVWFLVFCSIFCLFWLSISGRVSIFRTPVLIYLGGISYPLYLLHQNIGYVVINGAYGYGIPSLGGVFLAIIVSLALAHFVSRCIERPSAKFIKRIYNLSVTKWVLCRSQSYK